MPMIQPDETNRTTWRPSALRSSRWSLLVVFGFLLSAEAFAQPIDTNRPGFSYSPNVVGTGLWQFETGIAYTKHNGGGHTVSLPTLEIRTGIGSRAELFLASISWSDSNAGGSSTSGMVDSAFGTKIRLGSGDSNFQSALLFQVAVPWGDSDFTSDRWDPTAAFIWSYSGGLNVMGTVKVSDYRSGFQLDNGLKLPFSWGDSHSAFAEWEANLPEGGGDTHYLNGGYQFLIQEHIQFDINAGLGLNSRADDYRLGVGFSIRL